MYHIHITLILFHDCQFLDTHFGWQGTLLITSGLALHLCVVGLLMKPKTTKAKTRNIMNFKVFRIKCFWILLLNNMFLMLGFIIVSVHLPAYGETKGLSSSEAGYLISYGGVASLLGRVINLGLIFIPRVTSSLVYSACILICSVSTCLLPFCENYMMLVVYSCVYNASMGCLWVKLPLVILDILDEELLASALGYTYMFEAVGALIGAPIAGKL